MLGQIVLAALAATAQPSPAAKPAGQITAVVGVVTVTHDGRPLRASARAALYPGDRVETGSGGGAGAFLYAGQSVYLGPETAVVVPAGAEGGPLTVVRGEARATSDAPGGLTVAAGGARARIDRGTLRASAGRQGSRFWAETGSARVFPSAQAPPVALQGDQEVLVPNTGPLQGPTAPHAGAWSLRVDPLQLAGAADTSRTLRGDQTTRVNDEVARDFPNGPGADEKSINPANTTTPGAADQPIAEAQPNAPNAEAFQPVIEAQPNSASSAFSSSLALGTFAGASFASTSGGLNPDSQQSSLRPGLAGDINLITAQTRYTLGRRPLVRDDKGNGPGLFPLARTYYSIGLGTPPKGPISTDFLTGASGASSIVIPHTGAYLVKFDQYGIPDPALSNPGSSTVSGISGLLGVKPSSPQVVGARPLPDPRAVFNPGATFALGEFALQPGVNGLPQLDIRRSDQDRQIIKSPDGNDNLDSVKLNPDVGQFNKVKDFNFFPQAQYVLQPAQNSLLNKPTYATLNILQKAAVTTLLADSLFTYSRRTHQTRFVLNGQIIDITGYHPPGLAAAPAAVKSPAPSLRADHVKLASASPAGVKPPLRAFGPDPATMRSISGSAGGHAVQHPRRLHH